MQTRRLLTRLFIGVKCYCVIEWLLASRNREENKEADIKKGKRPVAFSEYEGGAKEKLGDESIVAATMGLTVRWGGVGNTFISFFHRFTAGCCLASIRYSENKHSEAKQTHIRR